MRTRARTTSTLTEANVQLLSSPARRLTRRNSGAMEPSTPTPVRRSTRASSITSDDVSINSNVGIKTRRTINIDKTLKEEDEKISTSPMSTRSTGSTAKSPVPVKVSPMADVKKATQAKQKVSPSADTPIIQEITETPCTTKTKEITAASIKTVSTEKHNFCPSLKISKIDLTEYLSPATSPGTIVINDSDEKEQVDDSFLSITLSGVNNQIAKHLKPPVTETKQDSEVLIIDEINEDTPVTNKQSRSELLESTSDKSSPAQIYPRTPKTAKNTLDLDADNKSNDSQTPAKQQSANKSRTKNNESSLQLDPKTPTKKSIESDVNKSLTKIDVISPQQLDLKTPTKNVDTISDKSVGTESCESSSSQLKSKTPTKNWECGNTSVGKENDVILSTQLDLKSPTKNTSASDKSIGNENNDISSPQNTPVKSLKPKTDNSFESETMNKLQHSQIAGNDRASPMLNVKQRTPLKKGVSQLNSSTPKMTAVEAPVVTEKSEDSLLNVTPKTGNLIFFAISNLKKIPNLYYRSRDY